jgi:threonine/homoserine/homoserine lactone efflux protein
MSPAFTDQLIALFVFANISAYTPGPNNVMLLASGVNHGFRRTLPHVMGVAIGFPVMTAAVALGLGFVFKSLPWLHGAIEIVGVLYLLWLAAKIAFQPVDHGIGVLRTESRPFGFFQAAAFQWVNVKGWIMAISGVSVYVPDGLGPLAGAGVLSGVYFITGIGSASTWAAFGTLIARFLHEPRRLRAFNLTMGALLVASLWPAWVDFAHWLKGMMS